MEVKGKILARKSDNKALKLSDDNWYNMNDAVIASLEKASKGDEVVLTYEKKGMSRYVSKLLVGGAESETEEVKTESSTGFACAVCGKELKDGKFKVCFICNKKGLKPKSTSGESPKSTYKSYDNPEKTAQIQRGNALNAAATVASSQQFEDPEIAKQFTLILADEFLTWLRSE